MSDWRVVVFRCDLQYFIYQGAGLLYNPMCEETAASPCVFLASEVTSTSRFRGQTPCRWNRTVSIIDHLP